MVWFIAAAAGSTKPPRSIDAGERHGLDRAISEDCPGSLDGNSSTRAQ